MLRRCVELALIVAIATLQCVSWADVDDARQPTRDGRAMVAATDGGVGVARAKGTASIILGGVVREAFVLIAPLVSSLTTRVDALVCIGDSLLDVTQAPRPPPTL